MRLKALVALWLATAIGCMGCAPHGVDAVGPVFDGSLHHQSLLPLPAGETLTRAEGPQRLVKAPHPLPAGEGENILTLRQALALALLQNPELAAFSWEVRAAEARTLQASLRPNPELGLEVENLAGSGAFQGVRSTQTTIRLSQLIELGGKRSRRLRVAALERDLTAWDYETKRLDVLTAVTQAFVEVLRAQERLGAEEELVGLAAQVLATVAERVKAGKASPVEETKARVALSNSRIALERARSDLEATIQRLVAAWGGTPSFQYAVGAFESIAALPSVEQLAQGLAHNPDLARWSTEIQQRQAARGLAQAQTIPDVTAGGGVRHVNESGDVTFVFSLSVPLPVFNRNQGALLETQYRLAKAEEERRAAVVRVHTALGTTYATLTAAWREVTTLQNEVLPDARRVFEAVNEGYRQGKFGLLDMLDAQRTLFEARGQYIDALAAYHKAITEAERLSGGALDSASDTATPRRPGAQP